MFFFDIFWFLNHRHPQANFFDASHSPRSGAEAGPKDQAEDEVPRPGSVFNQGCDVTVTTKSI